jgi:hypothetical protein
MVSSLMGAYQQTCGRAARIGGVNFRHRDRQISKIFTTEEERESTDDHRAGINALRAYSDLTPREAPEFFFCSVVLCAFSFFLRGKNFLSGVASYIVLPFRARPPCLNVTLG